MQPSVAEAKIPEDTSIGHLAPILIPVGIQALEEAPCVLDQRSL